MPTCPRGQTPLPLRPPRRHSNINPIHNQNQRHTYTPTGNIIGKTQTLTLFVEAAYKEYNTEAAFAAAVLLSVLALMTLWVKDRVEQAAAAEAAK